jgi:hypothetical protein
MIQIAYVSSTQGLLTADEIEHLLVSSRARNQARGITGVLLYKGGNVLQVIEGEEPRVLTLFSAIQRDPRHTGVIKIYQKKIVSRDFPEWTMGFHDLGAKHVQHLEGVNDMLDPTFDMQSLNPSSAATLLSSFKASIR